MGRFALGTLEDDVRVDDIIRKSVVYVGDANSGSFVPHGTGFIAASYIGDRAYQSVVTAKHVLEGIGPDVHLRLNSLDGRARVIALEGRAWKDHPNKHIDLSSCPTVIPTDQFDIKHIPVDGDMMFTDYANPEAIFGLGDDVIIAGMFQQRLGEARNVPIIRTGTIAAMPEEKVQTKYGYHDAYLIEVRSIDGLSGSPVFAVASWLRLKDSQIRSIEKLNFKFLGVLLGHDEVVNPIDKIPIRQKGQKPEESGIPTLLNTGIGIVAPADLVIEAVKHPDTEKSRMAAIERNGGGRRYVSDSITPEEAELPTTADNPDHREDFNSLLDAATAGKKSNP